GCVLALHAGHWLEIGLGIIAIALVISVHAQPVHMPAFVDLLLADYRNIIFRLAGDDAVVAADARIQVNRHAPRIRLRLVVVRRVHTFGRRFLAEIGFFLVLLKRLREDDRTFLVAHVHGLIALG